MSPTLSLSRQKHRADEADVEAKEQLVDQAPIATARQQVGATLATKAWTVLLLGCLFAGPLGLAVGTAALVSAAAPAPPPAAKVVDLSGQHATAGEFAQRLVVTWLTTARGHEANLTALMPGSSNATFPQEAFTVTDPAVAGITQVEGVWSVTVAATVTDQANQTARRFFQVPITISPDGAVAALSLPTPVPGPTIQTGGDLNYQVQVPGTGPVASTISQFLSAYAAGTGDVTRYLTPGVQLRAITPAPYTAVTITDLRAITSAAGVDTTATPKDGTTLRVLVDATGVVSPTQQLGASWALSLTARAGRWEITAIDPAPAQPNQTPAVAPTSGTAPSPSSGRTHPTPAGSSSATS
jgi:hypothetical protein